MQIKDRGVGGVLALNGYPLRDAADGDKALLIDRGRCLCSIDARERGTATKK